LSLGEYDGGVYSPLLASSTWFLQLAQILAGAVILQVRRALHDPNNVVALAEEGVPIIEDLFLLVIKIFPLRDAVFGLQRGFGEGARRVFAREDYADVSLDYRQMIYPRPSRIKDTRGLGGRLCNKPLY
jgi:hypothetical protein